jgi:glutathione S-transferase
MDSLPIAHFLNETYPSPALSLDLTPRTTEIEERARSVVGRIFRTAISPREIHVLSPTSQLYFRAQREQAFGCTLEEMLVGETEVWKGLEEKVRSVGALMGAQGGPFVGGKEASYTDFFVAGAMQFARVVDERTFERLSEVKGFRDVYEACEMWMRRRD